jgi:hypothetical protein
LSLTTENSKPGLEERLRKVEDRLEIYQLLSTYGPCADSGSGDLVETLFTVDGEYDTSETVCEGAAGVREMIDSFPLHRELMASGCAHIIDTPALRIDGDRAVAVGHSMLLRHADGGNKVFFMSAVRWEFERTADGWKIARRTNRHLDGNPDARQLLRQALEEQAT